MMLVSLLLCVLFSVQGADADMITIDGRTEPHKIPEWAAWESVFDHLASAKQAGGTGPDRTLLLSERDRGLVYAAAFEHTQRYKAHKNQVLTQLGPLVGKIPPRELTERNQKMILDYRQQTLDAAQRLLDQLSPEGRAPVQQFAERLKAGIILTVSKSNDFWKRPY
jgi:hypothetical protein